MWADSKIMHRLGVWYPSGLTGVNLFSRPVPRHEFVEAGHLVVRDTGENPAYGFAPGTDFEFRCDVATRKFHIKAKGWRFDDKFVELEFVC